MVRGKCRIEMRAWARDVNQEGGERDIDISKIITHTCEGRRSQVYQLRQPTDTDTDTQTQTDIQKHMCSRIQADWQTGTDRHKQTDRPTSERTHGHTTTPAPSLIEPFPSWPVTPWVRKDRTSRWTAHRRSHPNPLFSTSPRHTSLGRASKQTRPPSCGELARHPSCNSVKTWRQAEQWPAVI